MRAFMVYVRPIVEYNSIIWSPSILPVILMLWNQYNVVSPKDFLRERLKCLNIFSLELRRLHTDLFWCYKIVFWFGLC